MSAAPDLEELDPGPSAGVEVTPHSYTGQEPADGDSNVWSRAAVPARARDYNKATSLWHAFRARVGTPIAADPDPPKRRNMWGDDSPSAKRVWLDYKAGAAHYCEGFPLLYPLYWLFAAPVLALHMFFKAGDNFTQRPSYLYGVLAFVGLIAGIIALAHP